MTVVKHRTGSEGPAYDPYAFEEWTILRNGKKIVLHQGLAQYMRVDGVNHDAYSMLESQQVSDLFEELVGCSVLALERAWRRKDQVCRKCLRRTPSEGVDGYPGETLEFCRICGCVKATQFNEGAVI